MILKGKKVVLRAVEEDDLDMLRELSNDPEFEKMVPLRLAQGIIVIVSSL